MLEIAPDPGGFTFEIAGPAGRGRARLPMVGRYNVLNALAAVAAAVEMGVPLDSALSRLPSFGGVPGRMQLLQAEPFAVVVDFAHTAPSLEKALATLRPSTRGRLIVVIGAAGERDAGKRAPLGRAATLGADLALFTEEDSRSEPIDAILATMAEGARSAGAAEGREFRLVPDRREAIAAAIAEARPGDTVILSGKGHERTLERADANARLERGGRGSEAPVAKPVAKPVAESALRAPAASAGPRAQYNAPMRASDFILAKREGREHAPEELHEFIAACVAGDIPEYQVSAWLMAVCWRGMTGPRPPH